MVVLIVFAVVCAFVSVFACSPVGLIVCLLLFVCELVCWLACPPDDCFGKKVDSVALK